MRYAIRGTVAFRVSEVPCSDQYDACLGVVVGLYCVNGNSYSWIAGDECQGEMLLLADIWLKKQLEEYSIGIKRLSLNLSSA